MIGFLLGRPERLPAAMLARYPELAAIRYRRGGLPPRVGGWCLGQRSVAAITLWRTVWLGESTAIEDELLLHEARHVAHFGSSWTFPFLYLVESLRRGYWQNRFEVDAREYATRRMRAVTSHLTDHDA